MQKVTDALHTWWHVCSVLSFNFSQN